MVYQEGTEDQGKWEVVEAITQDTLAQTLIILIIPTNMGELIKIMQVMLLQQGEIHACY